MVDLNKHIWEGWTVGDFVRELEPQLDLIMQGGSWQKPFTSRTALGKWCADNQPYYKKRVPGVVAYFAARYSL